MKMKVGARVVHGDCSCELLAASIPQFPIKGKAERKNKERKKKEKKKERIKERTQEGRKN